MLGGRARLERATCREASLRHGSPKLIGAGKPARRFLAASSVSVIRVDPTRPPAHQCAWHLSPKRLPYSPRRRAQREYEPRRFSGPRKPGADGQCRRGPRTAAEPICRGTERSRPEKQPAGSAGFRLTDPDHRGVETNDLDSTRRAPTQDAIHAGLRGNGACTATVIRHLAGDRPYLITAALPNARFAALDHRTPAHGSASLLLGCARPDRSQ